MVTLPDPLDILPGQTQVGGMASPGQQSALADFAIEMTQTRQRAVRQFQEQTGLPQLPMQEALMNLEMQITQTLVSPLRQLPLPTEIMPEELPTPTDVLPTGLPFFPSSGTTASQARKKGGQESNLESGGSKEPFVR